MVTLRCWKEIKTKLASGFQCGLCSYTSERKYNMRLHLDGSHGLGWGRYQCNQCHLQLKTQARLTQHKQTWWISVRPRWMTMTSSVGGSRATHVISATTLLVIATTSRSIWRANMILAVTIVPTVTSTSRLDRTCQDTCSLHVL